MRRAAGLFRHADRGLISVTGTDRTRWLQGMLSNDVASLAPGPEASGCYAALLTPKGKIVADMQVMLRGDAFWLELAAAAVEGVSARLERYIIADDVTLTDESQAFARLGVEGPAASRVLAGAGADALPTGADSLVDTSIAGVGAAIARFGWSGEEGFQLFVPQAEGERVAAALLAAGSADGIVEADSEVLEILRVEAGVPSLGRELSEEVLPDEARLSRAISFTKGCYTGQEIVARLHSRGQVNHLLVGLTLPQGEEPQVGAKIWADGVGGEAKSGSPRPIGELTSVARSPKMGWIGLAFVRRAQAEPGTPVRLGDGMARVARLPFAQAGVSGAGLPESPDADASQPES